MADVTEVDDVLLLIFRALTSQNAMIWHQVTLIRH